MTDLAIIALGVIVYFLGFGATMGMFYWLSDDPDDVSGVGVACVLWPITLIVLFAAAPFAWLRERRMPK